MSAIICPTITAYNPPDYRVQLNRVLPFAPRIHVDFMDGIFAGPKGVSLNEAYWPDDVVVDIHIMYENPSRSLVWLLQLRPSMVIVHAEAKGAFTSLADSLHQNGIGVGVCLLPETPVSAILPALDYIDHVLIFSGRLGHNGGIADMQLLNKVRNLRHYKPELEIGWDGGVNISNARQLADGGVDVLNVGGFIQHATDPIKAYTTLVAAV
jgi:ribulose-phosphate 3-epimerase